MKSDPPKAAALGVSLNGIELVDPNKRLHTRNTQKFIMDAPPKRRALKQAHGYV